MLGEQKMSKRITEMNNWKEQLSNKITDNKKELTMRHSNKINIDGNFTDAELVWAFNVTEWRPNCVRIINKNKYGEKLERDVVSIERYVWGDYVTRPTFIKMFYRDDKRELNMDEFEKVQFFENEGVVKTEYYKYTNWKEVFKDKLIDSIELLNTDEDKFVIDGDLSDDEVSWALEQPDWTPNAITICNRNGVDYIVIEMYYSGLKGDVWTEVYRRDNREYIRDNEREELGL